MMGFAKIAGGMPSSVKAMANHLMNATLRPEESRVAAYYSTGVVRPNEDAPQTKREIQNTMHVADWLAGKAKPNLVRLADYAMSDGANLSPNDIEVRLTRELEMAIGATTGGDRLEPEVMALHGLPEPEPVPGYLRGLPMADLQRRLDCLPDQWSDAVAAADERAEKRAYPDPNAPLAIVRPDLHPLAAMGLGLAGDRRLTNDQVEALLAGRRADGELIEGKHYAKERRLPTNPKTGEERKSIPIGSYDFSTSADKSVSVAWAFAGPVEQARIFRAHVEASRDAVGYMAERVGQARIGDGGKDGAEPGHVAWLEFTHHTSRRTIFAVENGEIVPRTGKGAPGDPELHTHHLIPNAVFAESGRVGSLDTAAVPGFLLEAGSVYQMRLAHHLKESGFNVELDPETGSARMPDIPDDVRTLFSKRTAIGELMARKMTANQGEDWDALSQDQRQARMKASTQDLDQKVKGGKDDVADFDDWKRQAREVCGWEAPESFASRVHTVEMSQAMKRQMAYDIALPMLDERFQHKSVIQHFEPRIVAARGMIAMGGGDLTDVNAITAIMRERGVQQYGERTELIWGTEEGKRYTSVSTSLHEAQEKEFIDLAKTAAADRSGVLPRGLLAKHIRRSGLDFTDGHGKAQLASIERLGSGGRFGVALGAAGSGKSAMLRPLVAAWKEQGREVYGASLAWRQADEMVDSGIDRRNVLAFSVLIDAAKMGTELKLTRNSVVAVDEFGLLGTRQGLELLRLQAKHGFSVVALGDDKQVASVEAGAIVDLTRRALGAEQIPEIITTIRQQSEREKTIAGLFREGRAAEALDMKRSDGTAELAPGGYDGTVARVAKIYAERLHATGDAPTVAAPTNQDAHRISEAVRLERRKLGQIGPDLMTVRATDGERNYPLALAKGDRVRLFTSTRAVGTKGGSIGRNGSVLEVMDADRSGLTLKAKSGRVGKVSWETLETGWLHKARPGGRAKLAYGDAMTIHTAQGSTSREHILALPSGSQAIDGKTGYSGNTRHRVQSYLVVNDAAEREAVRKGRALNDAREITVDDRWANVARTLAWQPEKDTATAMLDRLRSARRGGVHALLQVMPDIRQAKHAAASPAQQVVQRRSIDRAFEQVRELVTHAASRVSRVAGRQQHGPSPSP